MKPAAKIMLGLGAAAATALYATRHRHQAAIRGTTLLMAGAARNVDWRAARNWIERGARVVVYARSANELENALRELRRLGPAASVQVTKPGDDVPSANANAGIGTVVGAIAAASSAARWLWPALNRYLPSRERSPRDDGMARDELNPETSSRMASN